ncbi:hypothetical protein CHU98_g9945 [Xylaria longipes]|nr:hypothetical protein CHU98_g9945 [Xylaria longipes]
MATTKAVVIVEKGKAEIKELPLPKLRDGYILVKVRAVGINPTDWKTIDGAEADRFGARSGCDYAGDVVEVGKGVTKDIKKGDRSSGFVFGGSWIAPDNGAFGEYLVAKPHAQLKTPDNVTDEEGATLGVSVTTVGQGLYKSLKLPLPNNPAKTPFPVLIYGGSTATGIYGIKYAKASGLTSPTVGADIRALTENKLKYAWDCTGHGAAISAAALSDNEEGGKPKYGSIIPAKREIFDEINPVVEGPYFTLGYDAYGDEFPRFGTQYIPDPEEISFADMFWTLTQELLASGRLTPLKPEVNRFGSGLQGVLHGLDELRNDRVSGTKLVYTL